jgi:pimeloyl-ACP methyl ester carboxylesterase
MDKAALTVGRFEIPYMVFAGGPRLLLCINGMQQTMASWRSVVRRITAGRRYSVALFDFPNQGRGRCIRGDARVDVLDQVRVLEAVVDRLSPQAPVALLGGSWGAVVAAAYSARRSSRVAKLVLGSFQVRPNGCLREIARVGRALVESGRSAELADLFITTFGTHLPAQRQRSISTQFATLRSEQFQQMYEHAERLVNDDDLDRIADLRAIRADTLIVNGGADPIVDADDPQTVSRIPGASLCVVPAVGHFLHVERPEVIDVYAEFLHRGLPPDSIEREGGDQSPAELQAL